MPPLSSIPETSLSASAPEGTAPTLWDAATVRRVTGDFPRRQRWVQAFTALTALSVLISVWSLNLMSAAFGVVFFLAAVSVWKATDLFAAAHATGKRPELTEALEQLEQFYRLSTVAVLVGLALALAVLGLALVVLVVLSAVGGR